MTKTAWISVDMEGISGIVDREQLLPGSRLYEASCALMMDDLDAVLAGLSERNEVGRIVVNDSHDGMLNLPWSRFGRGVDLISGGTKPGSMNAGVEAADFAIYLGYHAMAGTPNAVMDHTYSGEIREVMINHKMVGETGLNAAWAGAHGVPVILVSGDQAVAQEATELLPGVETVVVKEARSRRSARLLPPPEVHEALKRKTAQAVERYLTGAVEPLVFLAPLHLEIDLMTTDMADRVMFCPYMERLGGTRVGQTFASMDQLFRGFYTAMALAEGRPLY